MIMEEILTKSFVAGVERLSAWADLLDSINVFPVADGDTGRNLAISLSPLRDRNQDREKVVRRLLLAARGNSGNIASRFFSAFYTADSVHDLAVAAGEGRKRAWKAVSNPRSGTMLSIFDALADLLGRDNLIADEENTARIMSGLESAVRETYEILPRLKEAGVVDAGALGMYIFFEGFFYALMGHTNNYRPVTEVFQGRLRIAAAFKESPDSGYCVDFVVQAQNQTPANIASLTEAQDSVVIIPDGDLYKIHLHTSDKEKVKAQMEALGSVLHWEDDNLELQINELQNTHPERELCVMTDAAGSLTRRDAKKYGFTLLNSYLNVGEESLPETYFHPDELYNAMRQGVKVSTSQSSIFERHQCYAGALSRFEKVLYLCVGSVFTGNYSVVLDWKKEHDPQNRMLVIDTGAASGRLGTIVLATSRYLAQTNDMEKAHAFAQKAVQLCEEYVFLDKLQYLAAGGRLSRTSAFFGDMLKMKPVVSPQPEGAKKVGVVRSRSDQVKMALGKLAKSLTPESSALIMLEYSDNHDCVDGFRQKLQTLYPRAEIIMQPLSLTSGAHMGPGTWAIAFLPEGCESEESS
jgi:uncharacterized protein